MEQEDRILVSSSVAHVSFTFVSREKGEWMMEEKVTTTTVKVTMAESNVKDKNERDSACYLQPFSWNSSTLHDPFISFVLLLTARQEVRREL